MNLPPPYCPVLLANLVSYPDVSLEVTSALSKSLLEEEALNGFDLVMALVHPDTQIDGQVLLIDELVWVGDRSLPNLPSTLSLVLAPDGCVYRSRVISKLKQQTQQWRISYTNADLSGITAAIKQGLGISALAKSSVPKQLDIIRYNYLPKLGAIKICLLTGKSQHPQASGKLAEFIQSRLTKSN